MKKINTSTLLCAAGLLIAFSSTSASAGLLIYEPFDYSPSGSAVIGQSDPYSPVGGPAWLRGGSANANSALVHQVASGSLTGPSGFPASIGNSGSMMNADNTEYARMNLGSQYGVNSTLYYSLLLDVPATNGLTTANSNANANNDGIIAFNNSAGATGTRPSTWAGELTMRLGLAANTFNLGVRASGTVAGTTYWSADLTPGLTYLVVVGYTSGATAGLGGVNSLWINPNSASFGGTAPLADGTTVGPMSTTAANDHEDSLIIGSGIAVGADPNQTLIDEIRVGTTWADVTSVTSAPEPSTLMLGGFGALGLISWYRSRRR